MTEQPVSDQAADALLAEQPADHVFTAFRMEVGALTLDQVPAAVKLRIRCKSGLLEFLLSPNMARAIGQGLLAAADAVAAVAKPGAQDERIVPRFDA